MIDSMPVDKFQFRYLIFFINERSDLIDQLCSIYLV